MDQPTVRLLGRRAECEFLSTAIADAREGRSRVVVLRGGAGAAVVAKAGVMTHFKHAELAKIEGAGHWLPHDKPDEVAALIRKFLGRT